VSDRDIRWGIAGTGAIAAGFVDAIAQAGGGSVVAVASRTAAGAQRFGERFGVPRRHGSYEDLAVDADVDVVYVATPQSRHAADTLLYLDAGKHVLCEKPFALDARAARAMVDSARAKGLFLMEAIWSRFLPAYRHLVAILDEGRIGEPLLVEADFGYRMDVDPAHRLFRLDLGGGGLLDLGIYPLQLCSLVLGPVDDVSASGVLGETGVDEVVAAVLQHAGGGMGVIKAGLRVGMACTARIAGTHGIIDVPAFMHCPDAITVSTLGTVERLDGSYEGNGLRFEVDEVHRCLADGRTESAVVPLDETVALAESMDAIREQIGLRFPESEVLR